MHFQTPEGILNSKYTEVTESFAVRIGPIQKLLNKATLASLDLTSPCLKCNKPYRETP